MNTKSEKIKKPMKDTTTKIQIEFDNIEHHLNSLSKIVDQLSIKLEPIISPSENCKNIVSYPNDSSPFVITLFEFNQHLISSIDTLSSIYDNLDI